MPPDCLSRTVGIFNLRLGGFTLSGSPGSTYSEVKRTVTANGGLIRTDMGYLRDLEHAGKLGVNVRDAISKKLRQIGMGHLPTELPRYQEQEVRLYLLDSTVGRVIHAVLDPSPSGDKLLRQLDNTKAQEALQQIRSILVSTAPKAVARSS